jgi:YggT family protein
MLPLVLILDELLQIYKWVVIAWVVLSWLISFNVVNTRNRFVYVLSDVLYRVTEPVLRPIRRVVPTVGGLDLSPIVLFLIIHLIQLYVIIYLARIVP